MILINVTLRIHNDLEVISIFHALNCSLLFFLNIHFL